MTNNSKATPRSNAGSVTTTAAEVVAVESASKSWNEGVLTLGERRNVSALATHRAFEAGLIGKNKPLGTQDDYAQRFHSETGSGPISRVTVVLWRRLGKALAVGVKPDSVEFARLVQNGNDGRVGSVIDGASGRGAAKAIRDAINSCYVKGAFVPAKAPAKKIADKKVTPASTKGEGDTVPMGRNNSTRMDSIETLLAAITNPSPAERKRLADIAERVTMLAAETVQKVA